MAIISFDKTKIIEYVPEYGGNRNEPRKNADGEYEKPCVVRLKFVPYAKVQEYSTLIMSRTAATNDAEQKSEILQSIQRKQFLDSVESISGYIIDDQEVTSPEDFFETADADLIYEVLKAMESSSKLSEGQLKNFERASVGHE